MADETIADIFAEMRGGQIPRHRNDRELLRHFADRLKAALKREKAAIEIEADALAAGGIIETASKREMSKITSKNGADFGQLGDCAKMREALVKAKRVLHCAIVAGILKGDNAYDALDAVISALALPRRQCDVGSAEEQDERFRDFCPKYTTGGSTSDCEGCKASGTACFECALVWAQMPYETDEKGEVDDTNG